MPLSALSVEVSRMPEVCQRTVNSLPRELVVACCPFNVGELLTLTVMQSTLRKSQIRKQPLCGKCTQHHQGHVVMLRGGPGKPGSRVEEALQQFLRG